MAKDRFIRAVQRDKIRRESRDDWRVTEKARPTRPFGSMRDMIERRKRRREATEEHIPGRMVSPRTRNWHTQHATVRCARVIGALIDAYPKGLTWREIAALSGCGRVTVYRDLCVLEAAGLPLERVGKPGATYVYRLPRRFELRVPTVELRPPRKQKP